MNHRSQRGGSRLSYSEKILSSRRTELNVFVLRGALQETDGCFCGFAD